MVFVAELDLHLQAPYLSFIQICSLVFHSLCYLLVFLHVFFAFQRHQSSYWGDHGWKIGDDDDMIARSAYESLLRCVPFTFTHVSDLCWLLSLSFRVSLLQPTSPKFQDFAEQVRDRAASVYNYTFSEHEEVLWNINSCAFFSCMHGHAPIVLAMHANNITEILIASRLFVAYTSNATNNNPCIKNRSTSSSALFTMAFICWDWC